MKNQNTIKVTLEFEKNLPIEIKNYSVQEALNEFIMQYTERI